MLNIFKKNEKPQSKLASVSAKGLNLNEDELKKVIGGGNGGDTTSTSTTSGSGAGSSPTDASRKSGAIIHADF